MHPASFARALALALVVAGCNSNVEPDLIRDVGRLPESADPSVLVAPDGVIAGARFALTVTTIGDSRCTRAAGARVDRAGMTVTITPYDWMGAPGESCTRDLALLPREVALRLSEPGTWTLRVVGPSLSDPSGQQLVEVAREVYVSPPAAPR